MPKDITKLITTLDELCTKVEYSLEEYQVDTNEIIDQISEALDTLTELNEEIDQQLAEE